MVHHDPDLPGVGEIARLDAAAVRRGRLPDGEPIPTLGEALRALAGLDVWIEVKALPPGHDARLLAALAGGPTPERYAVHSFDHRIVRRLGAAWPDLPRGILLSSYLVDPVAAARAAGAATVWQEWHLVDRELVTRLAAAGMGVIAWTVNDDAHARRLAELGVAGLCGNHPDRLRTAIQRVPA